MKINNNNLPKIGSLYRNKRILYSIDSFDPKTKSINITNFMRNGYSRIEKNQNMLLVDIVDDLYKLKENKSSFMITILIFFVNGELKYTNFDEFSLKTFDKDMELICDNA